VQVAKADIIEQLESIGDSCLRREEVEGVGNGEVEHIGYALALVAHLERLAIVPSSLADVARHVHVWQEVHLDLDQAITLARLAATAPDVEREGPASAAAHPGIRELREQFADRREQAGVGGRVAARGAADRPPVDLDDLVELVESLDPFVIPGELLGAIA